MGKYWYILNVAYEGLVYLAGSMHEYMANCFKGRHIRICFKEPLQVISENHSICVSDSVNITKREFPAAGNDSSELVLQIEFVTPKHIQFYRIMRIALFLALLAPLFCGGRMQWLSNLLSALLRQQSLNAQTHRATVTRSHP